MERHIKCLYLTIQIEADFPLNGLGWPPAAQLEFGDPKNL